MKRINLRNYYSFYSSDFFIDVEDDIANAIKAFELFDEAYRIRTYRHKAYFSLNRNDGLENIAICLSPEEVYEKRVSVLEIGAAINRLPEKQAKRIYAHYFLGMSKAEIARSECVKECTVRDSIKRGLRNLKKYLKNIK